MAEFIRDYLIDVSDDPKDLPSTRGEVDKKFEEVNPGKNAKEQLQQYLTSQNPAGSALSFRKVGCYRHKVTKQYVKLRPMDEETKGSVPDIFKVQFR